jgi:hypothetical protein
MKKIHAGSRRPQGTLHRGTRPQPSPIHAGSGRPLGTVHWPQPQIYGTHGGTLLPRTLNKRKRK